MKRREERLTKEEEEQALRQRRDRAVREGKSQLGDGDGRGALMSAVAAMEGERGLQEIVLAAAHRIIADEVTAMEATLDEKLRMAGVETGVNHATEALGAAKEGPGLEPELELEPEPEPEP